MSSEASTSSSVQSEMRSYTRTTGLIALAWGLIALVLQLVVVAQSSRLPASLELLVPGYKGSRAHGVYVAGNDLVTTAWIALAVFVVVIVGGILLAAPRRWWILVVMALATLALGWTAAVYIVNIVAQIGAGPGYRPTVLTRAIVTVSTLVGLFGPLVTMFVLPAIVPGKRRVDA